MVGEALLLVSRSELKSQLSSSGAVQLWSGLFSGPHCPSLQNGINNIFFVPLKEIMEIRQQSPVPEISTSP